TAVASEPQLLPAGAALVGEGTAAPTDSATTVAELAAPRTVAELEAEMAAEGRREEALEDPPIEAVRAAEIRRQLIE
ncbi:hypothetical protein KK466_29765, partial [Klebsiella pneumoniae]|uniref:hypothetical protein n=1 Tax=Klebsiella pneumoniae TaxID=573 RepID=UPI001BE01597